jgi:hypothetical protein
LRPKWNKEHFEKKPLKNEFWLSGRSWSLKKRFSPWARISKPALSIIRKLHPYHTLLENK